MSHLRDSVFEVPFGKSNPVPSNVIVVDDPEGVQKLLQKLGITSSEDEVKSFLRDYAVGIMHVDEILKLRGMATNWIHEDQSWDLRRNG